MLTFWTIILLLAANVVNIATNEEVTVEVNTRNPAGDVISTLFTGRVKRSWPSDRRFNAFSGIPYAEPPVGEHRFRDPKPLLNWPLEMDARWDGHDCPSIYAQNASEDCLTLNVYSSDVNANSTLPVLVFIHPGGLYIGSGLSTFLGPEYLLEHRLVLVTFNYRLGTLGFLNLGTSTVPGNAGFKDQVLAMRWVKQYIHNFGGDRTRITLMGYSAGALSVSMHLVSPMSINLFTKAIIMSGSVPPQTPLPFGDQRALARRQGQILNCSKEAMVNNTLLLKCLNQYTGTEIAATLRSLFAFGKDNPLYLWLPIEEHDFGQERFLTNNFYDALRKGCFHHVPLLVGYTNGELCTSAAEILRNETLSVQFHNDFEQIAPTAFMYTTQQQQPIDLKNISVRLKSFYAANVNTFALPRLCDLFSDALVRFGSEMLTRLATASHVQVKRYFFTYRGQRSQLTYSLGEVKEERVEHMDDLMYLFRMPAPAGVSATFDNADDIRMVALYTQFIYNFVMVTGDGVKCSPSPLPVTTTSTINDCKALPVEGHIRIGKAISCRNESSFPEFNFWEDTFPTLQPPLLPITLPISKSTPPVHP